MNTTKEEAKEKLEQRTRHEDQQQQKTQTVRKENEDEQETNKRNKPKNTNKNTEDYQGHRPSENQLGWWHQQPNKTIEQQQTNSQEKEQEATRKRQKQQPGISLKSGILFDNPEFQLSLCEAIVFWLDRVKIISRLA
jgi:hypothetical protein